MPNVTIYLNNQNNHLVAVPLVLTSKKTAVLSCAGSNSDSWPAPNIDSRDILIIHAKDVPFSGRAGSPDVYGL